jgi:outer membrane immunogenic protein
VVGLGAKSNLDYFGTVRGRLGYAFGSSLIYATSGFAYGGIRNEFDNNFLQINPVLKPLVDRFQKNVTAAGFTVGGGWEYKLSQAWSLKTEYQFIDLERNDPIGASQGNVGLNACTAHLFSPQPNCSNDAVHTVRAGLNYHFGSGYEPLK